MAIKLCFRIVFITLAHQVNKNMEIADNKESMIADDQLSYNFIDRFPDIFEQIFGYLDHESLLNALLICTSWNKFIGQSSELMNKTRANFRTFGDSTLDRYKTIKAWGRKIIHLKVGYFPSPKDRTIKLLNENGSNLQHLTSLDISAPKLSSIKHILVTSLLLKNLKISYLDSSADDWNDLVVGFEKIKLKTLSIELSVPYTLRESVGIEQFLQTQTQLEELDTMRMHINSELMIVITQMEPLKSLKLRGVFGEYDPNIVGNMPSLEIFKVSWDSSMNAELQTFVPIANSAPNLITLDIGTLNQAFIDSAGLKLKKLKKLHAWALDFENISNPHLFPALEVLAIDCFIELYQQELILQAIADGSTNFKSCLYEELNNEPHKHWDGIGEVLIIVPSVQ